MIAKLLIKLLQVILLILLGSNLSKAQIKNGGFEEQNSSGQLLSWGLNNQDSANNKLQLSSDKYQGEASLFFEKNQPQAMLMASTRIPIETPGKAKLKITAFAKTNTEQLISNFYLQTFDKDNKRIGGDGSSINLAPDKKGEWQKVDFSIIISPEIKTGILFINLGGKGDLFIDDLKTEWVTEKASPEIQTFAEEALNIVKTNSIVSDSIDWGKVQDELSLICLGLKKESDEAEITNYLISELRMAGDNHSFYMSPSQFKSYTGTPVNKNNTTFPTPSGYMLKDQIAYVNVPSFGSTFPESVQEFADSLNNIVLKLQAQHPKGWIIDLSENTGGNMHPMIAGLNALIIDGTAITFSNKTKDSPLHSELGKFESITLTQKPKSRVEEKIAVLIGPKTASSGEMTLITLLGMPNVRTFGSPTAGFTTANSFINLSNAGAFSLATSLCKDRKGNLYQGKIEPQKRVDSNIKEDVQTTAINWILE